MTTPTYHNRATFARPFPALTPEQRYRYEVFGYVVVPGVFSADECGRMIDALERLKRDLLVANPAEPTKARVNGAFFESCAPHHAFMANMYEYDDALLDYVCHPHVVGMAEEVVGGEVCVTEFNAHLNGRDPNADFSKPPTYSFHTGADGPWSNHAVNGLTHCNFVKALTNLTDLGPDDGGTVVIAGSHKVDLPDNTLSAIAYNDRSLIHQVVAPAGSVLLFPETLVHATGQIRSDKRRAVIIGAYAPRMFRRWDLYNDNPVEQPPFSEAFCKRIPAELRTLLMGKMIWRPGVKYRKLEEPMDTAAYPPVQWPPR